MDSSLARDRERFLLPPSVRKGFACWLLWLEARHGTGLAVQQQLFLRPFGYEENQSLAEVRNP